MTQNEIATILIVDDEDSVRRVISKILSTHGYRVKDANCVDNALNIMKNEQFDILLTDHMMEGRTGLDLIVEAEDLDPYMVKILLTGFGDRDLYRDVINKGSVFSVLEKPSDAKQLVATIQRALEHRYRLLEEKEETEKLKAQYHTIFANTTDLIQCFDIAGSFIYANPAWHKALGYSDRDIASLTIFDIVHPDHIRHCSLLIKTLNAGKSAEPFETVFRSKDGRDVYLEGSATGQIRNNETFTATCILRDVTERKRASEEIQARLRQETMIARIAELLANTDEPVTVYRKILEVIGKSVDANRAYLYAINEVDKVYTKISIWESDSHKFEIKLPVNVPFADVTWLTPTILDGEMIRLDSIDKLPKPDKHVIDKFNIDSLLVIPVTVSTCTVGILGIDTNKGADGWDDSEINMLKAASDIIANAWTRQIEIDVRKQKELEADQSRLLVIRADRLAALGTMAAGIIHEITQPLNAINVSAQTILYGKDRGWTLNSEQVQKSLNLIVDQIRRMTDIITNMRAFARDGLPSPRETDNLESLIERVFTMIGEQMKAHDISVEFDLGKTPDFSMNTHQILQVILNLVTNARQALDETDKQDKKIIIRTSVEDNNILLEVSDNGPGIPENLREKIFDPFFTTKEVGKGTGLGLSISAGIVNDHKGELLVRNNEMNGATFLVRIPVDTVHRA